MPEMILLTDENNYIHVLKGENYIEFDSTFIKYSDDDADNEDKLKEFRSMTAIHFLKLAESYKVVGIIDKEPDDEIQKQLGSQMFV